jgi:trehalose 6-phosphate synthase
LSRLIIVSNRVNPPADAGVASSGGLAMALAAALRDGRGVWFGWSGRTVETYTGQLTVQRVGEVTVALVDLEGQDLDEYYNGYANRTLWPLFHYRTDLAEYERTYHEGYRRVNERFARALAPLLAEDDLIWVQDYHLLPLARELRSLGVSNPIGFFLHIPWPSRRLFMTLPDGHELVRALFEYDLIGFQAADHCDAFTDYVSFETGGEIGPSGDLQAFDRSVRVGVFPVGIDAAEFVEAARQPPAVLQYERLQESKAGRTMLLGIDRLDYSKGLEERFQAYERFLAEHPERHGHLFYLQIATRSREEVDAYQDLRARLDAVSGRINGDYADLDWTPLRYVSRAYRRDELAGVYRAADVALVTPLRDGMNLVAKEFVAAQDAEDPGVLILSRFAGAADQLREALIVNPLSRDEVSDAIRRAIGMPLAERRRRWEAMMAEVAASDAIVWRDDFVAALAAARERGSRPAAPHPAPSA